jgi:hypothetical protein
MSAGLFYVDTEPGTTDEAEFHHWKVLAVFDISG